MSEEAFGQAGTEQAQGFSPLPEPPREDEKTYGSDAQSLRDAATDLTTQRNENEPPLIERGYYHRSGDDAGKEIELTKTVKPERAAHDLTELRNAEAAAAEARETAALAQETDALRERATVNPDLSLQVEPDLNQPQPDGPAFDAPAQGVDPELAKALQHPQVRQAIEAEYGQATAAVQAYSQATAQATQVAVATLFSAFPEMANITAQQLPVALQMLAQTNPARHAEIMGHINRVDGIYKAHKQATATNTAIAQHQFQQYAAEQDRAFEESVKDLPPSEVRALGEKALDLAEKHYGVSREQLGQLWHTNDAIRSAPFQKMMLDATRYHVALEQSARPSPRPIPHVQRPGVREPNSGRDSASVDRALVAFRENATPKTAAALLRARRSAGA